MTRGATAAARVDHGLTIMIGRGDVEVQQAFVWLSDGAPRCAPADCQCGAKMARRRQIAPEMLQTIAPAWACVTVSPAVTATTRRRRVRAAMVPLLHGSRHVFRPRGV